MSEATTNLKDAKARLSELVDRAQAGETVTISRRGRVVAQLTASPSARRAIDVEALRELTRRLPRTDQEAGRLLRQMRDNARY
ncbi:type II toxin-antitoxin system Phd/YefM family antitoxin [Wenzhouxiangella limi]|uniref:Antitoxin n=1 Tax=Wenzhouxiangella limi TaxID=2707351 RepID=A0A845VC92_9GAMM|nr:type II toxin-antitoxin system prevent-host-death family antitoxin [Wenzhouxiangella limi]NDY94899.1 type II toxin-antitoxin system prevent-host-death family antitoxin [Wenzhouxiangella limi]